MTYSPTTWVNNSTPAISADNLNKIETGLEYIHGVATVAALRLEPAPTSVTTIRTLGCLSAGDGGGGLWRWDATSTDADNTGTVVLPTGHVGAGRWVRMTRNDGVIDSLWFGAKAGIDCASALQAAINAVPDSTADGASGYMVHGTYTVRVPDGSWTLGTKIVIPEDKSIIIAGTSREATRCVYTGSGNVAFEMTPQGQCSTGMENLTVSGGDVAVIGSTVGRINFKGCNFERGKYASLWLVDADEYFDGDEYPTAGTYTEPVGNAGFNVVGFNISECYFVAPRGYGLVIEATTALIGEVRRCRFIMTTKTSMIASCNYVNIIDCDFQGIADTYKTTDCYLWFKAPNVPATPFATEIQTVTVERCRFGSEVYTTDSIAGGPPDHSVVFGPLPADSAAGSISRVHMMNNTFIGGGATRQATHPIYVNTNLSNTIFDGNYFSYYSDVVVKTAAGATPFDNTWRNNYKLGATYSAEFFDANGETGFRMDKMLEALGFDEPTVAVGANAGSGATATIAANSNDSVGIINLTTGTSVVSGISMATVTYDKPYTGRLAPIIILTAGSLATASLNPFVSGRTNTTFTVSFDAKPADSTSYTIYYAAIQPGVDANVT